MADSNQRRRPTRRTPRASLSAKRLKQRDAQDALSACSTISDIMHVTSCSVELVAVPQEHDMTFVVYVGPVEVQIMPSVSRLQLKAEGLSLRVLQTAGDSGNIPLGQLEQLVAYLRYAGMHVPELRFETLPNYARIQLLEDHDQDLEDLHEQTVSRPSLSVVPTQQEPQPSVPSLTPLVNQRSLPPRRLPGNQRQEYAQA